MVLFSGWLLMLHGATVTGCLSTVLDTGNTVTPPELGDFVHLCGTHTYTFVVATVACDAVNAHT